MTISWGMFAPDQVSRTRRLQTLELAAAVRHYNERSVPGLGGLWFGMPVAWSLLGISLAENGPVRPLPAANAVEAGVMLQAISKGLLDRARGTRNLAGRTALSFKELSRRGAYVTQPYRMATVEPLLQLGFVEGSGQRFNLYSLLKEGDAFIKPFERERKLLKAWAAGGELGKLRLLMPNESLPAESAALLRRQLRDFGEGARRRRALLDLGEVSFKVSPLEQKSPPSALDPQHWRDMRSGIALIRMRESAIRVLDVIENVIRVSGSSIPAEDAAKASKTELEQLRVAAAIMHAQDDNSPGQLGHRFAKKLNQDDKEVVAELAKRDGAVVRLLPDRKLGLGAAGKSPSPPSVAPSADDRDASMAPEADHLVPELPRIGNLYALKKDIEKSGRVQ